MDNPMSSPIRNVSGLITAIENGFDPEWEFFWGHRPSREGHLTNSCFSQWWARHPFEANGVTYPTAEHFMMVSKARLFDDSEAAEEILVTTDPGTAKAIGRRVRGFDDAIWKQHRFDLVVRGNLAKFGSHGPLKTYLLDTGDRVLVEASPRDRIWGIGCGANNPTAEHPHEWRGLNLLGFALMEVRDRLR